MAVKEITFKIPCFEKIMILKPHLFEAYVYRADSIPVAEGILVLLKCQWSSPQSECHKLSDPCCSLDSECDCEPRWELKEEGAMLLSSADTNPKKLWLRHFHNPENECLYLPYLFLLGQLHVAHCIHNELYCLGGCPSLGARGSCSASLC